MNFQIFFNVYFLSFKLCLKDDNECALSMCDAATTVCVNTQGSYQCVCQPGYARVSYTACRGTY